MESDIGFKHSYISEKRINEICLDYVKSDECNFEKYIEKYVDSSEYLFLSGLGENIISWYKFNSFGEVLELNNDFGQITHFLLSRNLNITRYESNINKIDLLKKRFAKDLGVHIKCIEDIENDEKLYDYIILFNVLDYKNYKDAISKLSKKIRNNGKFIIVYENKNSLNTISCVDSALEIKEYLNEEFLDNRKILRSLFENGLKNSGVYAAFPNSYITSSIYNSKFIINTRNELLYHPYNVNKKVEIFDENEILNKLLKINPEFINYFSNSYFIESSFEDDLQSCNMISFNNYRKNKYSLITMINDKIVYKVPKFDEAIEHITLMKNGIGYLKHNGIKLLDNYDDTNGVYSDYVKNKNTFDIDIYYDYVKNKDLKKIANMYMDSYKDIRKVVKKFDKKNKNRLLDDIPNKLLEKMQFIEVCPWDMIAKNCFHLSDEYLYFDQEWYENFLPIEFLIYRSVINSYKLVKIINVDDIFEILVLMEYVEYFKKIDNILFDKIANKKMCNLLLEGKEKINLDQLIYLIDENDNLKEKIFDYEMNDIKQNDYILYLENIKDEYINFKNMRFKEQIKKLLKDRKVKKERKKDV